MQIPCGSGSVLLWRSCDTLCTSGFINDVTFGRNGCDAERWRLHRAATAVEQRCDTGVESDVYECLVVDMVETATLSAAVVLLKLVTSLVRSRPIVRYGEMIKGSRV